MDVLAVSRALGHEKRLAVLAWLKHPHRHFPPQVHGDKDRDGVCAQFIADKLGVTPATASMHLKILAEAGLIRARRIGKWTYFKRVEPAIAAYARGILKI